MQNYKIEEYKFAKEKLRKNEERRYQMIIICITIFGVIFGFLDKIPEFIVPIALLTVLVICVALYRSQTKRQLFTTAYIIFEFEKKNYDLKYESTSQKVKNFESTKGSGNFIRIVRSLALIVMNPFSVLLYATVFSLIYFGSNYYFTNKSQICQFDLILYILTNVLGYTYVTLVIIISRFKDVDYYLKILSILNSNIAENNTSSL